MNIAIVSIINEKYSYPFKVMLTSLLQNNSNLSCDYIVMYDGELQTNTINEVLKIYSKVKFVKIKNEFSNYYKLLNNRLDQWSQDDFSALSRFEIFNLIEYDKLIYLDVDIIINNSIDYLLSECNIDECYAVEKEDKHGFNAGVMVVNHGHKFNEYKLRCINFLKTCKHVKGNQDTLNICFKNSVRFISNKFNLTTLYNETETELKNNTSVILHFPGERKPWNKSEKFSDYYKKCNDWIKDQFVKKWYFYENIMKEKINETN
jgi:lipopolysaccharide biosynthesis glycosyltransferase